MTTCPGGGELRNGTGFVGRRVPTVLTPGASPVLRRLWWAEVVAAYGLGLVALALAVAALLGGARGSSSEVSLGVVLAVAGFGVFFLVVGEWLRRLLVNDAQLRHSVAGSFGGGGDVGGGQITARELAAFGVTPWGILNRGDMRVLLRESGVVVGEVRAPDVARAMAMVASGERSAPGSAEVLGQRRGSGPVNAVLAGTACVGGVGVVGVFGWRFVANVLLGRPVGAVLAGVLVIVGAYVVVAAGRYLLRRR